jgi:hypothetical protein
MTSASEPSVLCAGVAGDRDTHPGSVDGQYGRALEQLRHLLGADQRRDGVRGVADEQEREARVASDLRAWSIVSF